MRSPAAKVVVASLVCSAIAGAPGRAQSLAPDAGAGRDLAAKLCSNCHLTEKNGVTAPRADVPSFAAIANSPRTTPETLAAAIILPHPEMPGIALTRAEIRHLIAYVLSLKK
jgi:cytochrome c